MQIFCAVFNCSNRADREKNNSNYCPSIIKSNGKEALTLSKMRREKSLVQIFRKCLTEKKLEKTRMKIMLSTSPSLIFFSHKVHNIRFEKQIRILPQLMVIELGPPVSESSTRISKFHDPTDSEDKFYKKGSKTGYP